MVSMNEGLTGRLQLPHLSSHHPPFPPKPSMLQRRPATDLCVPPVPYRPYSSGVV